MVMEGGTVCLYLFQNSGSCSIELTAVAHRNCWFRFVFQEVVMSSALINICLS